MLYLPNHRHYLADPARLVPALQTGQSETGIRASRRLDSLRAPLPCPDSLGKLEAALYKSHEKGDSALKSQDLRPVTVADRGGRR